MWSIGRALVWLYSKWRDFCHDFNNIQKLWSYKCMATELSAKIKTFRSVNKNNCYQACHDDLRNLWPNLHGLRNTISQCYSIQTHAHTHTHPCIYIYILTSIRAFFIIVTTKMQKKKSLSCITGAVMAVHCSISTVALDPSKHFWNPWQTRYEAPVYC